MKGGESMEKKSTNCATTSSKGPEPGRTLGYKDSYKTTGKTDNSKASK